PDIDSYYLAFEVVKDLPTNQDLTARVFILLGETDSYVADPLRQSQINTLRIILSESTAGIPDAIRLSMKGTRSPTLQAALRPKVQEFREAGQDYLNLLDTLNFSTDRLPGYFASGNRALDAASGLWTGAADQLDELL